MHARPSSSTTRSPSCRCRCRWWCCCRCCCLCCCCCCCCVALCVHGVELELELMLGLMLGLGLEGAPDAAIVRHTRHATRDTPPAARGRRVQWRLFPPTLAPRCAQVRSGALRPRLEVSPTTRHATPRHDTRPGRFCVSLPVVSQRCLALPGVAWRCVALPACLPSLPNGQLAGLGEGAWHGAPLNLKSQIGP